MNSKQKRAALIGGGVIGGGWAARFLVNGWAVKIYDPAPDAKKAVARTLQNATDAYLKLFSLPHLPTMQTQVQFTDSIADAVCDAEVIVESAPERVEIKQAIYTEVEQSAPPHCLITSSTSGLLPSVLQKPMQHPERFVVAHPFNPVYLLPLVELVGGEKTSSQTITNAIDIFTSLGMHPLHIKKEIDAFIADRLLESVWREALWLVRDDIATTTDIDEAIRLGFGLRWAQMGLFETYRIAGGAAGMQHFLHQFAPSLKWPWSHLMNVPEMDDDFAAKIAKQSDVQSSAHSIDALARIRDDNVLAFLQSLRASEWGAGVVQAKWEKQLRTQLFDSAKINDKDAKKNEEGLLMLRTLSRQVPRHWADYNRHMNESRYLECFSEASDEILRQIGADENYVASGYSYFTVDTHIQHLREIAVDAMLFIDSVILMAEGKKLRLRHVMTNSDGEVAAIGEHLLIHVALSTRRSAEPSKDILQKAQQLAQSS